MMHPYSQSGQDDWVLSIIGNNGFFVDMGAFDGIHYSNTLKLEERGWDGLCIEANPNNYEIMKWVRGKAARQNIAIATYSGVLQMTDDGSSSKRDEENGKIIVECDTILNILNRFNVPKYIDYISSDLERMDADVWEAFPFNKYSFGLATVEHVLCEGNPEFKNRIMKVMLDNGYVLARENVEHDGNEYEDWYCSKELFHLAKS